MIPTINHAILSQVVQAIKAGNLRYCEALGFNHDELNKLCSLSYDELLYLVMLPTY